MILAERLKANAILDRLVADGPTFSINDARCLIALIPMQKPRRRFTFIFGLSLPGTKSRGHVAGHGDVEVEHQGETKTWSSDPAPILKIGDYEVAHTPGSIKIALMWSESKMDQSGLSCDLIYDETTGEPQKMVIAQQTALHLLVFRLATTRYVPWKIPRNDDQAA